jgi:hypothetical protein
MKVGLAAGPQPTRSLLKFDLSPLIGKVLRTATLELMVTVGSGTSGLLAEMAFVGPIWSETGVTWNRYTVTFPWIIPGGDYIVPAHTIGNIPTATGVWTINASGLLTLCEFAIAGYGGGLNIIIKRSAETKTASSVTFASSNHGTFTFRPKIIINYDEPFAVPIVAYHRRRRRVRVA